MKVKVLALAAMILMCTVSWAGPLTPPLGPLPVLGAVAGESKMCSFSLGCSKLLKVDWIVINSGAFYTYLYQIEDYVAPPGPAGGFDEFSVSTGLFFAASSIPASLDGAHNSVFFPNLATETEPGTTDPSIPTTSLGGTATWSFPADIGPTAGGVQTITLQAFSTRFPTYGNGGAQDFAPPSPWSTLAAGSDLIPVPIPIPEPSFYGIIGSGLAGLLWMTRRRMRNA